MLSKTTKVFLFVLSAALILSACSEKYLNSVICDISSSGSYNKIVAELLPAYRIVNENKIDISGLKGGAVVETYDILAEPAMEQGMADYWYPQYITTVVVAVDRSKSNLEIAYWEDLLNTNEAINISEDITDLRLLMAAMSYGLEGAEFSFEKAAMLLSEVYEKGLLSTSDNNTPIQICFDTAAVSKIISGENIEIIIPKEGTLSFEKGLLSNEELLFEKDVETLIKSSPLRALDGSGDYYPSAEKYAPAQFVENYEHFNDVCENAAYVFKRDVQKISNYLYSSADGRAHMLYALGFIIIIIIWIGYVIRRTMQKGIRRAVIIMASLVIGWVFLRMFKYQIPTGVLSQYCWYGYYFFQMGLSLCVLWLAWVVDRPNDEDKAPVWFYICAGVNFILFILIFSNNAHYLAFDFNPNDPYYNLNYSYGPIYYLAILTIFIQVLFAQVFFIRKSWKSPRKASFIFPFIFYCLLCSYCIGYILRIPFVWETDLTIITGTFLIIFIEVCIRAGLIPVNTKYKVLFENSPLKMQIANTMGEIILSSVIEGEETLSGNEDDFIAHTNPITGGVVLWQEDISSINKLHKEITASVAMLETANSILMEEERIRRRLESAEAKTSIFTQLETEINKKTAILSGLIENLPEDKICQAGVAEITLLLCYIKRRCNLFFRQRETELLSLGELLIYFNELGECAYYSEINIHITCDRNLHMPTKQAICFYDFLYETISVALTYEVSPVLVQIIKEDGAISLKLLYSSEESLFTAEDSLLEAIVELNGKIKIKQIDDAISIVLTFFEKEEESVYD